MTTAKTPGDWALLPVPVPPKLAENCGYRGNARWVSVCWQPCGDEADFDDGRSSGTGNWRGYLAYVQHPAIAPHVAGYNLGSSDCEPTHCLVIDRTDARIYVAPVRSAGRFLVAQHPWALEGADPKQLKKAEAFDIKAFLDLSKWQEVEIDQAAIEESMRQEQEALAQMIAWLDEHTK